MDATKIGGSGVDDQKIAPVCKMNVSTTLGLCP